MSSRLARININAIIINTTHVSMEVMYIYLPWFEIHLEEVTLAQNHSRLTLFERNQIKPKTLHK